MKTDDLTLAYRKIGELRVEKRLMKSKIKILIEEINSLAKELSDSTCPYCGTTELLCGYPRECSSHKNKE